MRFAPKVIPMKVITRDGVTALSAATYCVVNIFQKRVVSDMYDGWYSSLSSCRPIQSSATTLKNCIWTGTTASMNNLPLHWKPSNCMTNGDTGIIRKADSVSSLVIETWLLAWVIEINGVLCSCILNRRDIHWYKIINRRNFWVKQTVYCTTHTWETITLFTPGGISYNPTILPNFNYLAMFWSTIIGAIAF